MNDLLQQYFKYLMEFMAIKNIIQENIFKRFYVSIL